MNHPQIFVRSDKTNVLSSRHPWIWDSTIIEPAIPPAAGSVVDLVTLEGRWLARGVYNPASRIRVRAYSWDESTSLDTQWWLDRLDAACQFREQWMDCHQRFEAIRLVNSEGDGLSGLVIERFQDLAVIQATAAAVMPHLDSMSNWLCERYALKGVWLRVDEKMAKAEGMEPQERVLRGDVPGSNIEIEEFGTRLSIDLTAGQKTGYYLDQRTNRYSAALVASGRMLDVCTYVGGFSLAALRHGNVDQIIAIDSSARALAEAAANVELNGFEASKVLFRQADCFDELARLSQAKESFDTIVLDPPRLAGNREHKPSAMRAYHQLNMHAFRLLRPGGMLVTCSCSGRVSREEFLGVLSASARKAGRTVQIIEQRGADFDHPWDVACPESEYLKCIIARAI